MAYRFDSEESMQDALRRCAREQLDDAVHLLRDTYRDDPVEAVHGARKAVKKERALLRMARPAMPSAQRSAENAALRDAVRGLSATRDEAVIVETFDQLAERFVGQVPEKTFSAVRERLVQPHAARAGAHGQARRAAQKLASVRARIDDWAIDGRGWRTVGGGLDRTYRRGRNALRRARRERSDASLHDARKRVKDLWYELRLLSEVCGPAVGGQAKEAHRVADLLGDDHDLAVLRSRIEALGVTVAVDIEPLLGLVDYRRGELQAEAVYLGERLYAEKPKAFVRRIRRYWRAGRAEIEAVHERRPAELAQMTRSLVRA
jgi:CHAD domain-containing protein